MGHGIQKSDQMAYVGQMPWHQLGNSVAGAMTAAVALEKANLGWTVNERPIGVKGDDGLFKDENRFKALVRSDNGELLTIARSTYVPFQNKEAFAFADDIVGGGDAKYVTAGSLFGGRKVWMLAELTRCQVSVAGDEIRPYFLLYNSHDGSSMVRGILTPVRVVCANTLSAAIGQNRATEGFALRHTARILDRAEEARKALGLVLKGYDDVGKKFNFLAGKTFTDAALKAYVEEVLPVGTNVGDRALDNTRARRKVAIRLTHEGRGNDRNGIRGTWWAAYNGITELFDHMGKWRSNENHMKDVVFGQRASRKSQALSTALEYAEKN